MSEDTENNIVNLSEYRERRERGRGGERREEIDRGREREKREI